MTVSELIQDMLRRIRSLDRYHGRDREFKRDERALMKAISRYGYACAERGWHFQPNEILGDLVALLRQIVNQDADIKYFPIYLEYAVDKHIRTRAEELNARAKAAKATPRLIEKTMADKSVVRVIEPTAVELLDKVYRDLNARRKTKIARPAVKAKQGELL
jgi:hypothetical protein